MATLDFVELIDCVVRAVLGLLFVCLSLRLALSLLPNGRITIRIGGDCTCGSDEDSDDEGDSGSGAP